MTTAGNRQIKTRGRRRAKIASIRKAIPTSVSGTYPDNTGHLNSPGCFRCHDDSHAAKDGTSISGDCEFCHKQIEQP